MWGVPLGDPHVNRRWSFHEYSDPLARRAVDRNSARRLPLSFRSPNPILQICTHLQFNPICRWSAEQRICRTCRCKPITPTCRWNRPPQTHHLQKLATVGIIDGLRRARWRRRIARRADRFSCKQTRWTGWCTTKPTPRTFDDGSFSPQTISVRHSNVVRPSCCSGLLQSNYMEFEASCSFEKSVKSFISREITGIMGPCMNQPLWWVVLLLPCPKLKMWRQDKSKMWRSFA